MGLNTPNVEDILDLVKVYKVEEWSDMFERFLCDLLNISPDRLYELLEEKKKEEGQEMERKSVCCICGKSFKEIGNNPFPLKDSGECCDVCNEKVVEARIALITMDNPD